MSFGTLIIVFSDPIIFNEANTISELANLYGAKELASVCYCRLIRYFLPDFQKYRRKVLNEMKEKGIDAIICPPTAFPALPLGNALLSVSKYIMSTVEPHN